MANEGVQSAFTQLAIGGYKMCFEHVDPIDRGNIIDHSDKMNCGTRARSAADQSPGINIYGATVYLQPTPEEWAVLLPLMGFVMSGGTGKFSDARIPTFTVKTDRVALNPENSNARWVRQYSGCKVNIAQLYSSKGQPLNLALNFLAMSVDDTVTFTEVEVANNSTPFVHNQSTLTLDGTARKYTAWAYSINNRLTLEHNNSEDPTNIDEGDRIETVQFGVPANTEHMDLIIEPWDPVDRVAGIAGLSSYVRGGKSIQFTWDSLKTEATVPAIPLRGQEIRIQKSYKVYKDDADSSTIVALDVTA